jgi:hypothetical protein
MLQRAQQQQAQLYGRYSKQPEPPVHLPYLPQPYPPQHVRGAGAQGGYYEPYAAQPSSQLRVVRHAAQGRPSVAVYSRDSQHPTDPQRPGGYGVGETPLSSARQRYVSKPQLPEFNPITHQRNYVPSQPPNSHRYNAPPLSHWR